jgi:quaternary ammonium compound-resistance protein SugE
MDWFILLLAGLLEIIWAIGLKYTEGFTKLIPSTFTVIAMALSFWFLSIAIRTIPLGTAYAVWTGIGTVGIVIFGIFWLGEPLTAIRIACIIFILSGIIGLKAF